MDSRREWQIIEDMIWGRFTVDYNHNHDPKNGQFAESNTKDVTDEYIKSATPGIGSISRESNYKPSKNGGEEEFAETLHNIYGGDITLLTKSEEDGVFTPDYQWRGKLWELKGCSSLNAVNKRLRHGLKQIRTNPGGVIINCKGSFATLEQIEETIRDRLKRSSGLGIDVMIVLNGEFKVLKEK